MGGLKQIKSRLIAQWERGRFLKAFASDEVRFPYEVAIKGPSAADMVDNFDAVRNWVREIESGCAKNHLNLFWKEINHRQLGRNSLPEKVVFSDITDLAGFLGKKDEFKTFEAALAVIKTAFPELVEWTLLYPFELVKNSSDIERLLSIAEWRLHHPEPSIYLRQLSLPGVDTKFIEKHKKLLSFWFDILLDDAQIHHRFSGVSKFEMRYGFFPKPEMVRFRVPDSDLKIGSFSDLTVRSDEFASFSPSVKQVFIIENDITALSFPPVKDSLVIFGRGYNFDYLVHASWLNQKQLWYWGDIDTHGFAILNQFRTCFPDVRSFLMDSKTLMAHREHWGVENKPVIADLTKLNMEETCLYDELRYNRIRENLRLEQEFVDYSYAMEVINSLSP